MSRLTENKIENRIISDFIGDDFFNNKVIKDCYYPNMKFKTSWDWLMPVVEKISDIKSWSINTTLEWLSENQDRDGLYDISDVYEAVVEFINYYNKNS